MKNISLQKGFSVIEILISASIITSIGIMIVLSFQLYTKISFRNNQNMQAALLFEETSEVIQFMRDQSWSNNIQNLDLDTEYFLNWNGTEYETTTEPSLINGFTRNFILSQVERDFNNNISNNGTLDPNTLLVNINVGWSERDSNNNLNTQMLIHNVYNN
jgi:Tfp pilus assembly protein PilV